MSVKELRVYHRQRYDTLEAWVNADPVLLPGEIAVSVYNGEDDAPLTEPQICIKIGDGTSTYTQLPFLTAKAGDVYPWAKAATKPTYNASEIEDLADFITDAIEDTNTTYQIVQGDDAKTFKFQSKELGDSTWTDAFTLHIPDDITYTISSDGDGKVTLTPSTGDPTEVTVIGIDEDKEDIIESSTNVPTSKAVAGYVKDAIDQASLGIFQWRGTVDSVDDLPTTDNKLGDVYHVKADEGEYAWSSKTDDEGNEYFDWEPLGKVTKNATQTEDGLMSKEDKTKLDGIEDGAQANKIDKIIAGDQAVPIVDKTVMLAKIAHTGNVLDLVQDEDNVIILNGGDSLGLVASPSSLILDGGNSATPRS